MDSDGGDRLAPSGPPVAPPPSTAAPTAAAPRRRSGWFWFWTALGATLLLLVLAVGGVAVWVWGTEAGTRQVLALLPGLQTSGVKGRVTGGAFSAETLRWQSGGTAVTVQGLRWRDLSLHWRPYAGAWIGLTLQQPQADAVVVTTTPQPKEPNAPPLQPPADLKLPLAADVIGLAVGSIKIDGQLPITDLRADLHVGADGGRVHRIESLQLKRGPLAVSGTVSIGSDPQLPLQAALKAVYGAGGGQGGGLNDWQADLDAQGPLRQLDLKARLDAVGNAAATVNAKVEPFKPFPLAALNAKLQQIDLAALAAGLPRTSLSGSAVLGDLSNVSTGQPLSVKLDIANAEAGPWDAKRLPVRRVHIDVQGSPEQLDRLRFDALQLELGGDQPAGRITGSGRWQGDDLQVDLRVADLQPRRLDGRAPEMRIEGPIQLALHGLSPPATAASASTAKAPLRGEFKLALTGQLPKQGQRSLPPVTIDTRGRFESPGNGALHLVLEQAAVKAGEATASATADARLSNKGQWQFKSAGALAQFDPGVWLPDAAMGGGSALNAHWQADVTLPPAPVGSKAKQAAAERVVLDGLPPGLTGDVRLQLDNSKLAGLPLKGDVTLKAGQTVLDVLAALQAGSNRVDVQGSASAGNPGPQRWKLDLKAPALAELAPLKRLLPGSGRDQPGWFPDHGSVMAQATASGHWPALKTEGTAQLADYSSPLLTVRKADARWTFSGLEADAPLSLDATVEDIAQGVRRVEQLQVKLDGTPRAHTLSVQASSPIRPPEWVDATSGVAALTAGAAPVRTVLAPAAASASVNASAATSTTPGSGSVFILKGNGGWTSAGKTGGGGRWVGTVALLQAAPRMQPSAPWLAAHDLRLDIRFDDSGAPLAATVAPNRIEAFGGALRWQQAKWQPPSAAGLPQRIDLDATIDPVEVAPWLTKLQPQFGWSGDLALAGTIRLRSDRQVDADVVVERSGAGDLSLTIDGAKRALGLKQLRLSLNAHNGLWELKQSLDGRNIGVISGSQTVQAQSDVLVPDATAPLKGSIGLVVPQLQVWAPWLPPGWRLGGRLQAGAVLSGSFGAPAYTGNVLGSELVVKNLFQGVDVHDGDLAVALEGTEAKIERFVMKSNGDGVLRITGGASFGAAPKADLVVKAEKFRALDRIDRRVAISGNADVGFAAKKLKLDGKFTIDEGLIDITQSGAPTLDDDVVVFNQPGGAASTQPPKPPPKLQRATLPAASASAPTSTAKGANNAEPAPPPRAALALADVNLRVDLGKDLRLRGRGLNTLLRGELVITTPGGELAVNGVVRAEEGTYTAYGQNLSIDRGRFFFTGAVDNPRLDILAIRQDIDTRVGVIVSGPAANPRVRLYSEPSLNEFDTLTWLVLGRAPEGLGRDDTALLQRAALALLAGDKDSSGGVISKLGLDELSVGNGTQGTIVSLGKQISKRVFIGYEKALSAAGGTWNLIYRVAGRITLRARAGSDNAIDAIWTWRWD